MVGGAKMTLHCRGCVSDSIFLNTVHNNLQYSIQLDRLWSQSLMHLRYSRTSLSGHSEKRTHFLERTKL